MHAAAASSGRTQDVPDVHARPEHIASASTTNSEVVVPVITEQTVIAVLDVDSVTILRPSLQPMSIHLNELSGTGIAIRPNRRRGPVGMNHHPTPARLPGGTTAFKSTSAHGGVGPDFEAGPQSPGGTRMLLLRRHHADGAALRLPW